ncbi:MAG TPA: oligosaccharide flippase family protein [Labilithrix sp.]|jgi:stage V sporulation protein B
MAAEETAAKAGRGGLAVLAAKVFFILTGFVQQPLLRVAIGQADYGALSRVLAVSNVFNNVVVSSSTQGVSRTVAAAGVHEKEALRAALRVHGVIAIVAAALLVIAAPIVASFQHASEVAAPLIVMAGVLGIYGIYAPLIGYLNGRARFTHQASLDVLAATLRTIGLLGVGWLFVRAGGAIAASFSTSPGVLGATVGAVGASLGVFLVALRLTGRGKSFTERPSTVPRASAYVGLIVPIMIAQLFTNALMQTDIFMLGRYLSLGAVTAGVLEPEKAANEWVGVYRASQLFAFLPYQMLFSVTQILFPMLAKAQADEGPARVAELVRRGSRIGAIVCGLVMVVVVGLPKSLISFAYGADVSEHGHVALSILAIAQGAFAMFGLAATVLVSLGRERVAMLLTAVSLGALVVSCAVSLGRPLAFGEPQLVATAIAAATALCVMLVVAVIVVRKFAGAFVPLATALRVGVAVGGAWAFGWLVPIRLGKLLTPVASLVFVGAYVVALVVMRELRREDLSLALSVVRRKK